MEGLVQNLRAEVGKNEEGHFVPYCVQVIEAKYIVSGNSVICVGCKTSYGSSKPETVFEKDQDALILTFPSEVQQIEIKEIYKCKWK